MINKAKKLLDKHFGYKDFRKSQIDIVESILSGNDTIGIMPTGGGKSICFQIPALIFKGLTIVSASVTSIASILALIEFNVDSID